MKDVAAVAAEQAGPFQRNRFTRAVGGQLGLAATRIACEIGDL